MLLGALGTSVLKNMLTVKGVMRTEKGILRGRAGYNAGDLKGESF